MPQAKRLVYQTSRALQVRGWRVGATRWCPGPPANGERLAGEMSRPPLRVRAVPLALGRFFLVLQAATASVAEEPRSSVVPRGRFRSTRTARPICRGTRFAVGIDICHDPEAGIEHHDSVVRHVLVATVWSKSSAAVWAYRSRAACG